MWLSRWERAEGWERVPPAQDPDDWAAAVRAQAGEGGGPTVLLAHAEGCLAVAHAVARAGAAGMGHALGALLVAPPDAEQPLAPPEVTAFGPGPWEPLPFRAVVVGSQSDPLCEFARAAALARAWDAALEDAGAVGRLGPGDGLGRWDRGRRLLDDLLAACAGP